LPLTGQADEETVKPASRPIADQTTGGCGCVVPIVRPG
jgi:hypothetical protein